MKKNIKRMPFIKMFMPKRKNKGAVWASLAGIGIGAAVYGMKKGKSKDMDLPKFGTMKNITSPIKDSVKNIVPKMNINNMDNAALTEFSEDLLQNALNNNKNK
ncbi:hypothetical protein [Neobacillus mesonae]|uniref:hypothetical protein n=1 Tax=Neobacillus mesonae TaxID=1193713 RepID=UPI00203E088C|nr:hypothetical protein [Neobacillus mesonae]MCM3568945.1 hypothetical protein [Neobacillus mesonae]